MTKQPLRWLTWLFFLVFLIAGFLVYKDYGVPWDEPTQIQLASLNHRYIFQHDEALFSSLDRYYGMVFELPYFWITTHSPIPRHLLIFLTFFVGVVALYFLARRLFHGPGWALLACVLLAASPRIFADSFYNSKDIPFMVIVTAGVWILTLSASHFRLSSGWFKTALWVVLLSLVSAAMIDTRIVGIVIIPLTFFLLGANLIREPKSWKKSLILFGGYLGLTAGLTILFWPVMWSSPLTEFLNAFRKMSQYPFLQTILYMGRNLPEALLPWHYLPVWIAITTPLIVLAGFLPGAAGWIKSVFSAWKDRKNRDSKTGPIPGFLLADWTVVVLWLSIPVLAVFIFHSSLYDGWRQMFFIYPAIVLLSVLGLRILYRWMADHITYPTLVALLGGAALLLGLAEPVGFMARYHPFENVYFNLLAGNPSTLRSRFEMDYWGLSYKQGIDYILANDPEPLIKISVANPSGYNYVTEALSAEDKSRVEMVEDPAEADYFVTEFRWHPQDYPYPDRVYSAQVRGEIFMAVFKMH